MPKNYGGTLDAKGLRAAIVASRFNSFIVEQLVSGAVDAFVRCGAADSDVHVYRCPGAFEIPAVAARVIALGEVDAVVCVGAVIRGATPHFEYVAGEVSKGLAQLAQRSQMPVSYGIITTDTVEQAIERAGTKAGNKGFDSAMAAVELVNLYREHLGGTES